MPEYSMVVKVTQTGANQVTGKINALEKAMTLARDRANELLTKLNALGSAANITFNLNTSDITSAESSVNDVTQAVEELNNKINQLNTERFQQLNANINTTSANVGKAKDSMGGLGKVLKRVGGMVASVFVTGQIASWGREAISTASDMERLKNYEDNLSDFLNQPDYQKLDTQRKQYIDNKLKPLYRDIQKNKKKYKNFSSTNNGSILDHDFGAGGFGSF